MASEFLLRVKPLTTGGFCASCSQLAGAAHPDVRAVVGQVGHGEGANVAAAMVAAISNAKLAEVREVPRNGC